MSRVSLGASCGAEFARWVCCGGPPRLGAAEAAVLPGDLLPHPSLGLSRVTEKSLNDKIHVFQKRWLCPHAPRAVFVSVFVHPVCTNLSGVTLNRWVEESM